jgi:hypothetical protein
MIFQEDTEVSETVKKTQSSTTSAVPRAVNDLTDTFSKVEIDNEDEEDLESDDFVPMEIPPPMGEIQTTHTLPAQQPSVSVTYCIQVLVI